MKVHLMSRDRDFDLQQPTMAEAASFAQDLALSTLVMAMAQGDRFLSEVAEKALLSRPEPDPEAILYRQEILADCLKNAALVREVYAIAVSAIENERKQYLGIFSNSPGVILHRSVDVMQMFIGVLRQLRNIADRRAGGFTSEGFTGLFAMLVSELNDAYFASIDRHLGQLRFRSGVLVSAELGTANRAANYVLRRPLAARTWLERLIRRGPPSYTLVLHPRDESGARALAELRDRGINLAANALAQSVDHILGFFRALRTELAFYIGCLNLRDQLAAIAAPVCFPVPAPLQDRTFSCSQLYDACLALTMKRRIVGNDIAADGKELFVVTGANQGGKSTFLRAVGLAQLMMQAGMFVSAEHFHATVCDGIFTHFKREEDAAMESGKLDEELARMSGLVEAMTTSPILLLNESFAATNEREGSEIARQITLALLESRVRIFYVTHLYDFAQSLHRRRLPSAIFLRANRGADRQRSFRLSADAPLETSYGEDLYRGVFRTGAGT